MVSKERLIAMFRAERGAHEENLEVLKARHEIAMEVKNAQSLEAIEKDILVTKVAIKVFTNKLKELGVTDEVVG